MSELIADLFVSLDACASAVDVGPYFGYGGPELDQRIQAELDKPQVIVLGRVAYEALASFSSNESDRGSRQLTKSPKVVVSSTLSEPLEWANTGLIAQEPSKRPYPTEHRWSSGIGGSSRCRWGCAGSHA